MSPESKPRRREGVALRKIGDEGGLVVLPDQAEVKSLNPVGIKIYGLLDGEHTVEQIATAVEAEFDVSLAQARSDVEAFLGELRADGMLAPEEGA